MTTPGTQMDGTWFFIGYILWMASAGLLGWGFAWALHHKPKPKGGKRE